MTFYLNQKQQLEFAGRMYEYHKMLTTKFTGCKLINIGVLINSTGPSIFNDYFTNKGRPRNQHHTGVFLESSTYNNIDYLTYKIKNFLNQKLSFNFPVIHIAKFLNRQEELKLLAQNNPFAIIVLYQLVALKHPTKRTRTNAKIELINLTRKYGYPNKILRDLIYLIDRLIVLPENLNIDFYNEVKTMETEVQERFVSIFERMGKKEGQIDMLLSQLKYKFSSVPDEVEERVKLANSEQINEWSLRFVNAQTIEEVFK